MPTDALRISGLDLDISDFARIAHRFGLSSEVYLSVNSQPYRFYHPFLILVYYPHILNLLVI